MSWSSGRRLTPLGAMCPGAAGERAEEVRGVLVDEASCSTIGVDDHAADRVDREATVRCVAVADCGDQFDGFANVAQDVAATGLV